MAHYKNGREAHEGDPVVIRRAYLQRVAAGTLHSINAQTDTCNAMVAIPAPGECIQESVNIKDIFHAEDALMAIEMTMRPPAPTDPVVTDADRWRPAVAEMERMMK